MAVPRDRLLRPGDLHRRWSSDEPETRGSNQSGVLCALITDGEQREQSPSDGAT